MSDDSLTRIEQTLVEVAARLDSIESTNRDHSRALLDQGFAMRDMLAILRRIEERLRHPGTNGRGT
jgi:hypothetical protein